MAVAVQPGGSAVAALKLEGEEELLVTGSEAIAHALRLADVDIVAAYPIRPYDAVMQAVATMIANGQMDCEYIVAEGEHSQFELVKHASAVGARSFVGSSGVGWFYAFEAIAVTAGLRLPVVANVGNRALDDPGAFGVEHNDALAVRDAIDVQRVGMWGFSQGGWIAPLAAAQSERVAFVVGVASTGVTPSAQMMYATAQQLRLAGYGDEVVERGLDLRRRFEDAVHAPSLTHI